MYCMRPSIPSVVCNETLGMWSGDSFGDIILASIDCAAPPF